jgi:Fe-S-cluster containining protein
LNLAIPVPEAALKELYTDLDSRIAGFSRRAGLACPEGCGTCCQTFVPELSAPEADLIAGHILSTSGPLTADSWLEGELSGACPFYRVVGDPYHCGIYPARPLICRLFGYAGSRGKDGSARFRPCRHMPVELPVDLEIDLLMEPFGLLLESLAPGAFKETIGSAVRHSLERMLLINRMRASAGELLPPLSSVPTAG